MPKNRVSPLGRPSLFPFSPLVAGEVAQRLYDAGREFGMMPRRRQRECRDSGWYPNLSDLRLSIMVRSGDFR